MSIQETAIKFGDTLTWNQKIDMVDLINECLGLGASDKALTPLMVFLHTDSSKLPPDEYKALAHTSLANYVIYMAKKAGVELKVDGNEMMGDIAIRFGKSLDFEQKEMLNELLEYCMTIGGDEENLAPFWVFTDVAKFEEHWNSVSGSVKVGAKFGMNVGRN